MTTDYAYVAFDVDRIKDFVFAGSRPRDLSGASAIVRDLDDLPKAGYLDAWSDVEVIYSAGGGGLLKVPIPLAEPLARHMERTFRARSVTGSLTAVCNSATVNGDPGAFNATRIELGSRLRLAKAQKAISQLPEATVSSYLMRCQGCGIYPACEAWKLPDEKVEPVCASCAAKRKAAIKSAAYMQMAQSMEEIGSAYVAVINIDINAAGDLFMECISEHEIAALSAHLSSVNTSAMGWLKQTYGGRYQSPLVGGDDLVCFVPAHGSHRATVKLVRHLLDSVRNPSTDLNLSRRLRDMLSKTTVGAGLLIASTHLPLRFLFDMSTNLVDSAKAFSKLAALHPADKDENQECSAVDFWLQKGGSPVLGTMESARQKRHSIMYAMPASFPDRTGALSEVIGTELSDRPYLLGDFDSLIARADQMRDFTLLGQVRAVTEAFSKSPPVEAHIYALYQTARNPRLSDFVSTEVGDNVDGDRVVRLRIVDLLELAEIDRLAGGEGL